MTIEIDQSGKVEQMSCVTVICIADNSFSYTIQLSTNDKRKLQSFFREIGQIRNFILFTFAACLALILENNLQVHHVLIDKEYEGKEKIIKSILFEMLSKKAQHIHIEFGYIGKNSPAHKGGYKVFKGREKTNKVILYKEVLDQIKKTKAFRLSNA
jgi:hypothetical protein